MIWSVVRVLEEEEVVEDGVCVAATPMYCLALWTALSLIWLAASES
jgi:hypothetical protein